MKNQNQNEPTLPQEFSKEPIALEPTKSTIFSLDGQGYERGLQIADTLANSTLVPQAYQKNVPNVMIALEIAARVGISPFMAMQNLHIIQGKPSWSSKFVIAALRGCGRFKAIKFVFSGTEKTDERGCHMEAIEVATGEHVVGPKVDWRMVRGEGWDKRGGSKWLTMPELMFQYRAATMFAGLYAPDILQGMHSEDEVIDISFKEAPKKEDYARDKERQRARAWIESANTIDRLGEVIPAIDGDEELQSLYDKKYAQLSKLPSANTPKSVTQ